MRSKTETFTEQGRRRQIIDAAIELIARDGFVNASVARIADHAGVAKSAVLYYFEGKDALVAAVLERVMGGAAQLMAPAILAEKSARAGLAAYIRTNCEFLDRNRTASVALFEIMTSFRTAEGLRLDQAIQRSAGQQPPTGELALLDPQTIIEQGVAGGEFAAVDPVFTKNALRAALDGAVSELARDPEYDVLGYGEQLVELFTNGLSTPRVPSTPKKTRERTS